MSNRLIIFVKNPELGKVKTRLAADVGDSVALAIYYKLLEHTRRVVSQVNCSTAVYYSDYVDNEDAWVEVDRFQQTGAALGERMSNAFQEQFNLGYKQVAIIGSDNIEISAEIIDSAFRQLQSHDVVVGPAKDGGYYLLGLNNHTPLLFKNISWSGPTVFNDTLSVLRHLNLNHYLLPKLNDIDTLQDLRGTNLEALI